MSYTRRLLERTAVSFFVVTLIFSRQFAMMRVEKNRFFMQWGLTDGLELIAVVSLLSVLAVCISMLVDALKSQWATKIFQHIFVLALVSGLLTLHGFPEDWIAIIWLAIMAVVGFSLRYPGFKLVKVARTLSLILSPLSAILFIQMFMLSTWNTDPQPRIAFEESEGAGRKDGEKELSTRGPVRRFAGDHKSKNPIFFFIFDAWSYRKSTADGEFHPYFENLRSLTSKAFVFRQAHSPGTTTKQSLPMILYQKDISFKVDEIFQPWIRGDSGADSDLSSLFERARAQGYSTALIGTYFPYPRIFGKELDYWYGGSKGTRSQNFGRKMLKTLVYNLRYLNDPISQRLDKRVIRMVHSRNYFESTRKFVDETLWLLEHSASNTFAFFHLPPPHWPYVFNPDGTYFGHEGRDYRGPRDEAGYVRHLKYLDNVIGRIVSQLQKSGRFDNSLIILTADHASSLERRPREVRTHVPLIIKLPGQKNSYVIDKRFQNNQLAPIIEAVLHGDTDEAKIRKMIEEAE